MDSDFAVHSVEGKKVFLCVADTHGLVPPAHFTGGERPDALLLLGDLGCTEAEVLRCYPEVPAFGVAGNHDPDDAFGAPGSRQVFDLHGRSVTWGGITIGGLGARLYGGFYDAHAGSEALRGYILRAKPKLVVHGHLHRQGVTVLGSTVVQAVYGWEFVEYSL